MFFIKNYKNFASLGYHGFNWTLNNFEFLDEIKCVNHMGKSKQTEKGLQRTIILDLSIDVCGRNCHNFEKKASLVRLSDFAQPY